MLNSRDVPIFRSGTHHGVSHAFPGSVHRVGGCYPRGYSMHR